MNSFYSYEELKQIGFAYLGGEQILLSRKASIYSADKISIGNNTRIDDFCILSGRITIGSHVHIAAQTSLFGGNAGITIEDFSCISSRGAVYALSDDYSGKAMTNPTVPAKYRLVTEKAVTVGRHALIGTGCTILPGITIGEGASVGAMSLINCDLKPWKMYAGIPCHEIKDRERMPLEYEKYV